LAAEIKDLRAERDRMSRELEACAELRRRVERLRARDQDLEADMESLRVAEARVDKGPVRPNHVLGGCLFGLGWAATGACPGPILALMGAGLPAYGLVFLAALAGTLAYGALRRWLPH